MEQAKLLKRLEKFGKIPPSKFNIALNTELKQLLRDLYRYIKNGGDDKELEEMSKTLRGG